MLSVKMHLTKMTRWNQVKSEDDAAEKLASNDAKKAVIPDLRNTQDAKGGASNHRKARGAGEATGTQQGEREG